ncbi:hypothetical protein HPB51_000462 [Rhipicephalus microplus]|uniref:Tc1-like transposase DDE domain-containing protein n=1 Tax=Rhipicephalus microplus TaxID=6941 RepID=A0A9J6E5W9_RHIMP|nr:hypothetical protein HPB51_000462 [Rhipicephalus microplus]
MLNFVLFYAQVFLGLGLRDDASFSAPLGHIASVTSTAPYQVGLAPATAISLPRFDLTSRHVAHLDRSFGNPATPATHEERHKMGQRLRPGFSGLGGTVRRTMLNFVLIYAQAKQARLRPTTVDHVEPRFEPRNLEHVASSRRCSISLWGALSKEGLGPLVRIEDRLNAVACCDLIEKVMVPYALDGPFPDGLYFFQQDRSPIHMGKSTARLLKQLRVMLLKWPPQGANMNICENVWGAMKKALSLQPTQCGSQEALWAAIKEELECLRASDFETRFFDNIPGAPLSPSGAPSSDSCDHVHLSYLLFTSCVAVFALALSFRSLYLYIF